MAMVALCATLLVGACASQRVAEYSDPELDLVVIDELVLMPVVDQRENRLEQFDVGRHVRSATGKVLHKKGYTVVSSRHLEGGDRPPLLGFETMSAGDLSLIHI